MMKHAFHVSSKLRLLMIFDDIFVQEALWETGGRFWNSTNDLAVISKALRRPTEIVLNSNDECANLIESLVDNIEASWVLDTEAKREVQ